VLILFGLLKEIESPDDICLKAYTPESELAVHAPMEHLLYLQREVRQEGLPSSVPDCSKPSATNNGQICSAKTCLG
jgi:hypothetical protein